MEQMEEILTEGRNFKLVHDSEIPNIIEFLEGFLPDSIKFHQTLQTFLKNRIWNFYFYVTKTWPEQPVILHFPGMTKTTYEYNSAHVKFHVILALC
ncbi:hypothetical protein NQ317_017090 [Molorchus minor]|uniref:Uncharacterized protein n=1 Tax=Molorchus minor TaxID=1323400 RepID=A0ABQ9K4C9_9CUCU|nr:hypothetical protein NQ317_017090 [Molorchus minor]